MMKQSVRVLFKPDGKEVWVVPGSTVEEALLAAAIPVSISNTSRHTRRSSTLTKESGHWPSGTWPTVALTTSKS